jgi:phosphoglucomutase
VNSAFIFARCSLSIRLGHNLTFKSYELYLLTVTAKSHYTVMSSMFCGSEYGRTKDAVHKGLDEIAGQKVEKMEDYSVGLNGLPKSDVLKYFTSTGSVVVRPSGTEPKLKTYISVTAEDKATAEKVEKLIVSDLEKKL